MSRYGKLQECYRAAIAAERRYWDDLYELVRMVEPQFENFLQASEGSNEQSDAEAYVLVGTEELNGNIQSDPAKLVRDDRSLKFSVRIDLTEEAIESPKSYFVFRFAIRKDGSTGPALMRITDTDSQTEIELRKGLHSLYEYMYNGCLKKIG